MTTTEHDCLIAALIAEGNPLPEVARQAGLTCDETVQRMVEAPTMHLILRLSAVWHGVVWSDEDCGG